MDRLPVPQAEEGAPGVLPDEKERLATGRGGVAQRRVRGAALAVRNSVCRAFPTSQNRVFFASVVFKPPPLLPVCEGTIVTREKQTGCVTHCPKGK